MTKKTKTVKKQPKQDLKADITELTLTLQRVQAEFENYKKRTEAECTEFKKYAETDLIKSFLPVLDNFELALQNKKAQDEFVKGMELIYSQLFESLEQRGLKVIKAEGEKFDPYKHEALLTEKSTKEPNMVLQELQKGYMVCDKVIRHTKVKVSKK
ncbi:nucleotide exchange factor GrpE [Candidatus Woesearchaeota archaeon]|nr:nucleotide exchange factor GrpE [Candidatus Woesearchaeota archaeon]